MSSAQTVLGLRRGVCVAVADSVAVDGLGHHGGDTDPHEPGVCTFEWTGNAGDDRAITCIERKPASQETS